MTHCVEKARWTNELCFLYIIVHLFKWRASKENTFEWQHVIPQSWRTKNKKNCSYDFLHVVCHEQMNEKSVHCSPHTATDHVSKAANGLGGSDQTRLGSVRFVTGTEPNRFFLLFWQTRFGSVRFGSVNRLQPWCVCLSLYFCLGWCWLSLELQTFGQRNCIYILTKPCRLISNSLHSNSRWTTSKCPASAAIINALSPSYIPVR